MSLTTDHMRQRRDRLARELHEATPWLVSDPDSPYSIPDKDLDRASADADGSALVAQAGSAASTVVGMALLSQLQQDQRLRRDELVARQGYRARMLGCLETMHRHLAWLDRRTQDA